VCELEHRLADGDALVLRGEGVEGGELELPYAPLTSALRPLVRGAHPALEALSASSRAQLAVLLPGLGETAPGGPGADRGQLPLFEALLEVIDALSASRPLVLILEDMHWADRSTSTFISFLVRGVRDERLGVLLTYRTDELHRRHPLRPLLAELERLDNALLAADLDGQGPTPQSLCDAFMLRIERMSPEAQRVTRAMAAGGRLDEAAIVAVTELEPPARSACAPTRRRPRWPTGLISSSAQATTTPRRLPRPARLELALASPPRGSWE